MFKFYVIGLLLVSGAVGVRAQSEENEGAATSDGTEIARQLGNRDPLVRQRAAEELAGLAELGNRKMLEGYRLQEKNQRVKLALDWALYRIGKKEALFSVIRALETSRLEQANAYLTTLGTPEPLYLFLETVNGNTQLKLIDVLAKIGDEGTPEKLRPYSESFDPAVADAAREAIAAIEQRFGQPVRDNSTRPRQVGSP